MGHHAKKKFEQSTLSTKDKLKLIKKERKEKLKEKRARLVVRNLPFQTTEENLREHFEKFGEVENVTILKKEDGKLIGCGFIQFKLVQKAAKARHHTNGKAFLGREIFVDFALAMDKFKKKAETIKVEVKEENEVQTKEKPRDVEDEVLKEEVNITDGEAKSDEDEPESVIEEEEEEDEKPRVESNDIVEGKTVFVKNVPFTATNEDLKQCMRQFGPLYYALICVDKYTEHSKGTAFVKFQNKEDAEKALSAGTELTLLGNILDCHRALGRNEINQKAFAKKEEKEQPRDSRNLYLVKEGVILAGTKAAEGVSASDMAKRLQLEQYKTQMLRNLNMFISRERLIIHNLPATWDDKKLRELFKKYSPKGATIKEVRIMRDLKNVDPNGVGKSKEYGFVGFTKHEHALEALRILNNNPNIFSATRRPIVAFSIENKSMIKAKMKRLEKSKLKNPECKQFDANIVKMDKKKKMKEIKGGVQTKSDEKYVGITAKPGVLPKMRNRYKLTTQAKLHYDNLKKEKKKQKFAKKTFKEKKEEFTKQPKQKINKNKDNDNFSKMVSDYKKKLMEDAPSKKTKWFES